MVDGSPRGLPKPTAATAGGAALPDGWALTTYTTVASDAKVGTTLAAFDTSLAEEGDLMIVGGATRNASMAVPVPTTGAAWTTVVLVDTSSSEYNMFAAKVCNATEDATVTIGGAGNDMSGALAIIRKDSGVYTTLSVSGSPDHGAAGRSASIAALAGDTLVHCVMGGLGHYNEDVGFDSIAISRDAADGFIWMGWEPVLKDHTSPARHISAATGTYCSGGVLVAR